MSTTKKPSTVYQTEDGGEQTRLEGFDELPVVNSTIAFTPAQGTISAILPRERADAITTRELARITGRKPRDVTRAICAERRAGAPILSDPGAGFWLASDAAELHRCTAALHRRAGEIHETARALEKLVGGR